MSTRTKKIKWLRLGYAVFYLKRYSLLVEIKSITVSKEMYQTYYIYLFDILV